MTVAEQLGRNLSRIRREAGMSQGEVGGRASLHPTAIGLLERGERNARVDTVVRLAGALEVGPGQLFDGITWKPAATVAGRFELRGDS